MGSTGCVQSERAREREFYKYYDPIRALSQRTPIPLDLKDADATASHVPRAGPDLALTAFCQLGALRLAARRSLLFFFDRENAFILAEATRTLSLLDHETHRDDRDALWLGHTVVPRGLTLCEHTMNIPTSNVGSNGADPSAGDVLIINDLQADTNFCDRPFVRDGPRARFYAGVPLTTPAGVRIGVYAVMDDEPREGLSKEDIEFMKEMSATTMAHLTMVHAQTELSRQSRMLRGLGTFVRDGPPPAPGPRTPEASSADDHKSVSSRTPSDNEAASKPPSTPQRRTRRSQEGLRRTEVRDYVSESEQEPTGRRSMSQAQKRLDKHLDRDSGAGSRHTLQRASDVIRHAVDADGVLFLDVAPHGPGGTGSCQGSGTDTGNTDGDPDVGSDDSLQKAPQDECRTLGASCRVADPIDPERVTMSDKFLTKLLRRHPQGKIWTFNVEGDVSSTESGSSDASSSPEPKSDTARGTVSRQSRKSNEAAEIRRLFPGARAVCLVGLWDPIRAKWFAASLMWTYSPLRVFSAEGELAYMLAFCDVVMAKVARREAKMTDRAKTDFISSVSHELRSPLHGIVGSLELLQERDDLGDGALIAQMDKCTRTLTDVIDHLLDFAKINHHASRSKTTPRKLSLTDRRHSIESFATSISTGESTFSLARLTEEVADATYYSHCCAIGQEASEKVDFALDISLGADFTVSDAMGAWKRLCVDLIGNALRFTDSGHVVVSLKALSRRRNRPVAVLTVSDSGCGMSKEFVESGLFRSFRQEDPLTPGTGVGLSVVARLVKDLGGKIEVQSIQNRGTTMTVMIPIEATPRNDAALEVELPHETVQIGLLKLPGSEDDDENSISGRKLQLTGIASACRRAGATFTTPDKADMNMVFEQDLEQLVEGNRLSGHPDGAPLIVLCRSLLSTFRQRKSQQPLTNVGRIEYLPQPFGPDRLSTAITRCLRERPQSRTGVDGAEMVVQTLAEIEISESEKSFEGAIQIRDTAPDAFSLASSKKPAMILTTTEVKASSSEKSHSPRSSSFSGAPKLSLLLVDDNPVNLKLLTAYADKNQHPRLTAINGQEAVNTYIAAASTTTTTTGATRPDVVFLDINMPIMDGFQAARLIRAFEKENHTNPTLLVALTCLGSDDAKQEAKACGIDMFLTKPVRPRDLTKFLQNIGKAEEEIQ